MIGIVAGWVFFLILIGIAIYFIFKYYILIIENNKRVRYLKLEMLGLYETVEIITSDMYWVRM